jgi:hypothetical protein
VARGYSEAPAGPQAALIHQRFLQRGRAAAAWRKSTARRLFVLDGCVLDEDRPHHTGLEAGFGAVSKLGIASGVAFDVMAGIIGQQSFTQIAVSTGMDAAPSYAGASAAGGLADRADGNSVMFANLGSTNRTFDAADIANIQSLYGSASNQSTPPGGWISTHAAGTTPANPAHGERLFH